MTPEILEQSCGCVKQRGVHPWYGVYVITIRECRACRTCREYLQPKVEYWDGERWREFGDWDDDPAEAWKA